MHRAVQQPVEAHHPASTHTAEHGAHQHAPAPEPQDQHTDDCTMMTACSIMTAAVFQQAEFAPATAPLDTTTLRRGRYAAPPIIIIPPPPCA